MKVKAKSEISNADKNELNSKSIMCNFFIVTNLIFKF